MRTSIIAPHVDDAFLSLGGFLARRPLNSRVFEVFTESGHVPRLKRTGLSTEDISSIRRIEELNNLRSVNAKGTFLEFPDAPLRGYSYLFGSPKWEYEAKVMSKLRDELLPIVKGSDATFFPLSIGSHIDHSILARIGLEMVAAGIDNVYFYEDLPYAARTTKGCFFSMREMDGQSASFLVPFSLSAKLSLCRNYRTQLGTTTLLFIALHAKMIKPVGGFYERVWKIQNREFAYRVLNLERRTKDDESSGSPRKLFEPGNTFSHNSCTSTLPQS